ncbi:hypothetical protein VaNZ11_013866 [Volvox africanus]|uniref:Cleavage/polyadenylation specificity factor A subunit N-terminal domain-containing protein n=1 Tax=Volvox africanus TaxID=51714 RepID=A0ABQ5SIJ4_9CHLO|nr:hypothetical protein VaNZ11_013866 [Volvox africanus]
MAGTWLSKTLVPSGVVDHVVCGSFVESGHPGQAQVILLHAGSSLEMLAIGASGAASSICSQPLQAGEAVLDLRVLRGGPTNGDGHPDSDSLILLVDGGRVTVLRFSESCNRFILVQEVQLVGPGTQPRFMPRLLAPSPSGQHGVAMAAFQNRILYLPPASIAACTPAPTVTVAAGESATSVPSEDACTVPRAQVQASISGAGTGDVAATAVPTARYRAVLANTPVPYIHRLPLGDAVPPPVLTAGPIVGAAPRDLRRATADALMASGSRLAASGGYLPLQLEPGCGAIWDLAIIESPCLSTDRDGAVAADGGLEGRGAIKSGGKGFDGGWVGSAGPGHRQERQIAIGSGSGSAGECGFRVVALVHRSSTDAGEVLLLRWIPGAPDLLLCDLVVRLGAGGPSAGLSSTGAIGSGQGQREGPCAGLESKVSVLGAHDPTLNSDLEAGAAAATAGTSEKIAEQVQRRPLLGMAHVLRATPPEHEEAGLMVLGTHGAVFLLAALLVRHALPTNRRSDLRTVGSASGSAPALEAASPLSPISAAAATAAAAGAASAGGNSSLSGMAAAHPSADGRAGADGASAAASGAAAQPPVLSLEGLMAAAFASSTTYREAGTREGPRHSDGFNSSSGNGEGEDDDDNNDIGGPSTVAGKCRRLEGLAACLKFHVGRSQPPPAHHLQRAPEAASGRGWAYLRFAETQFAVATGTVAVTKNHVIEGDGDDGMEVSDGTGSGGSPAVRQAGSAAAVTHSGGRRSGASAMSGGGGDSSWRSGLCRYVGEEDDLGPGSRATWVFLRRCGLQRATGGPVRHRLLEQLDRMASMIKLYRSVAEHAVFDAATTGSGGGTAVGTASRAEWAAQEEHLQRFSAQPASQPNMLSLSQLQNQAQWMLRHLRREELAAQLRGVGDSTAMKDLRRAAGAAAKAAAAVAAAAAAIEDVNLEECQGNAARPLPPLKQAPPVIGVERLPLVEPHDDGHILSAAEWLPPMLSPATCPFGCNSIAGAPPKGPRLLVCAAAGPALCITLAAAGAPPGASRATAAAAAAADVIETTAGAQAAVSDRSFHDNEGTGGEVALGLKSVAAAQEGTEGNLPVVYLKAIRCLMPSGVSAGVSIATASTASPAASGRCATVRPARALAALPSWSGGILVWSEEGGDVLILRHRYKPLPQLPQQHRRRQLQRLGLQPRPVALPTQPSQAPPSPTPPAISPLLTSAFAADAAAGFQMDVGTCAAMTATTAPWSFACSSGSSLPGDGAIAGPSAAGGSQPPPRRRQGAGILGLTPGAGAWCQDAVASASGSIRGSGAGGPACRTGISAELRCDGPRRRVQTAPGSGGTILGQPRTPKATVRKAPLALSLRLLGRAPQPRPMVDFVVTETAGISGHGRVLQVTGAVLGLQPPEGAAPGPRGPKLQVLRGCLTAQVVAHMPSQGATPTGLWSIPLRTPIAPAGVAPGMPSHAGGVVAPVPNPQPGAPPAGGSLIVLSFVGGSRALAPVLDTDFAAGSGSGGSGFGPGTAPSPLEVGVMEPSLRDVTDALQLRHWEPTVAAGLVAEGVFVQVTPSGILMASLDLVSYPASGAAATVAVTPSGGSEPLDDGDGPGVGVGSWDAPLPRSSWPSPKSSRYEDRIPLEQMPQLSQPLEAMHAASTRLQRQQRQHHREQQLWHGDGSLGPPYTHPTATGSMLISMGMLEGKQMPGAAAAAADRLPPGMAATSGGGGGESRGPSINGYSSMAEGMGVMALASDMQADDNAQGAARFAEALSSRQDGIPGAMSNLAHTQDGYAAPVFYGPFTSQCLQSMPPPPPPPALGPHALDACVGGNFQGRNDAAVDAHDGDGTSTSAVEAEVSHGGVAWWNATALDVTTGAVAPGCVVLVRRLDRRLTVLGVVQQTTSGGGDGSGTSRLSRKRPRSTLVLRELGFSLPLDCEPSCCALRHVLPSRSPSPQPRPHSTFRRSPSSSSIAAAIASAAATVPAAAITDAVDSGAPGISVGAGTATALSAGLPPLPPRPGLANQGGSPVLAVAAGGQWSGPASVSVGGASGGAPAAAAAAGTVHASSWRYQLLVGDHAPSIQLLLLTYGSSGLCCTRLARVSTAVPPGLGPCGGLTGPQSASVPESVLFIAPAPVPTAAAAVLGPGGSSGGGRSSSSISTDRRELRTVMPSGLPGTHGSESAAMAPAAYSVSPPDGSSSLLCLVGLRSGVVTVFSYGVAGFSAPAAAHQVPSDDMEDLGFPVALSGATGANSVGGNGDGTEAMGSYTLEASKGPPAPEAATAAAEYARRSRRNGGDGREGGGGAELPGVLRLVWRCSLEQVPVRLASLAPCRPWQVLAVGSAVHLLELTAPSGRLLCSPLLPSTGNWIGTGSAATPHQPLPPPSKGLEVLLAAPLYLPAAGIRDVSGAGVTAAIAGESRKQRPVAPSPAGSLPLELALVVLNDGSWRLLSLQRLSRLGRQPPSAMPLGPDSGGTMSGMAGACPATLPIPGTVPIGRPRLLIHVPQLFPHRPSPGHAYRPSIQATAPLAPCLDGSTGAFGSEAGAVKGGNRATASHVTSPGGEGYLVLLADDAQGSRVQQGGSRYVHVLEAASGRQVTSFDVDAAASGFLAACACMWQVRREADDGGGEAVLLGCRAVLPPGPRWQQPWWGQAGIREDQSVLDVAEVAIAAPPPAAAGVELHNGHVGPGAAAAAPMDEDLERGLEMVREMVGEVDAVVDQERQRAPPRWWWQHGLGDGAEAAEQNDARGPRAIDDQLEAGAEGDGDAEGPMDGDVAVVARRLWHLVEAEMIGQALPNTRMGSSCGAAATGRRCRPPTGVPHMLLVIGCTGQGGGEVMVLHMVPALLQLVAQQHGSGAGDGVSSTAAAVVRSPNANTPMEDWFPWPLARSRTALQRWLGWSGWAYPGGEVTTVAVEPASLPPAADNGDGPDALMGSPTTPSAPTTAAESRLPTTRVVHLQVVHRLLLANPVTAICPYNEETLVVAAGRRMLIYTMRDGRLHRTGWVATRNPITVMSACSARSLLACTDGVTGVMLYTAVYLREDSVSGALAGPPVGLRLIAADAIYRPITSLLLMPSQSLPSRQLPQSLPLDQSGPSAIRTGGGAGHASPPGEAMDAGPAVNERNGAREASGQAIPAEEATGMNGGESSAIIAATDSLGRLLLLTPGPATLLSCRNLITLAAVPCPDAGLRLRAHLPNPVTRYNMARPLQPKVPGLLLAGLSGAVHQVRPCPDAAVPLLSLLERALASHWAARLPTGGRHRSAQEAEVDALDEAGRWWWWCHQGHPGVLDGDLLEQLLDLPRPAKLQVLRRVPAEALRAALAAASSGRDTEYYEAVAAADTKLQALAQTQEQGQGQEPSNDTVMQVDGCAAGPPQAVAHEEEAFGDRPREAFSRNQPQQLHGGTSADAGSSTGAYDDDDLDSVLQVLQDVLTL